MNKETLKRPFSLEKCESILAQLNYILRYDKGRFQSGACVLRDKKIVVVNKFLTKEQKIHVLQDIIKEIQNLSFSE